MQTIHQHTCTYSLFLSYFLSAIFPSTIRAHSLRLPAFSLYVCVSPSLNQATELTMNKRSILKWYIMRCRKRSMCNIKAGYPSDRTFSTCTSEANNTVFDRNEWVSCTIHCDSSLWHTYKWERVETECGRSSEWEIEWAKRPIIHRRKMIDSSMRFI